ncbi:hypothetical protein [Hydrogenobacter hydrogenophilus]|nr:hypothetical protein [Hydrogenobacter hydrogenophilus]
MKKKRIVLDVDKEIYAELYNRFLVGNVGFLLATLLEEFLKRSDLRLSPELNRQSARKLIKEAVSSLCSSSHASDPQKEKLKDYLNNWW